MGAWCRGNLCAPGRVCSAQSLKAVSFYVVAGGTVHVPKSVSKLGHCNDPLEVPCACLMPSAMGCVLCVEYLNTKPWNAARTQYLGLRLHLPASEASFSLRNKWRTQQCIPLLRPMDSSGKCLSLTASGVPLCG